MFNWLQQYYYHSYYRSKSEILHIDWPLLISLLLVAAIGFVILYSAGNENIGVLERQGMRMLIAFSLMWVLAQISPATYKLWTPWLFGFCLLLLATVLLIGVIGKGAQRWLNLWIFQFQPSELMKLVVPMTLAWYLSEKPLPPSLWNIVVLVALTVVPAILVAKQPDLGTALLIAAAGFSVILLSGIRWRFLLAFAIFAAAALPVLWHFMHSYQRNRVLIFLNPESDPLGSGYHIIQSKIAIGAGGLLGKGWLHGSQSHLQFLPERATDFIFAVYGEEFGLVGATILLLLCLFIVERGLYISMAAQDTFSRLLASGLSLTFFFAIFVNIGMVTGLLPVVGVPLPLVSYGGTSLITFIAGFGILMSIHTHRKLIGT